MCVFYFKKQISSICVKFIVGLHIVKSMVHFSVLLLLSISFKFTTIDHWRLLKTHSPSAFINTTYSLLFSYLTLCSFQSPRLVYPPLWDLWLLALPQNLSHGFPSLLGKTLFLATYRVLYSLTHFYIFDDTYIYIKSPWPNKLTYWIT